VWRHREATERQAALLFARLAGDLRALGTDSALVGLARQAAEDERRHAVRCRAIVRRLGCDGEALAVRTVSSMGPPGLTPARRTLFAAVAISCVTETLSTALLLEMRGRARDDLVRRTVHEILRDEIDHARIGWAHLATESRRGDVGWLAAHLPGMLRAAIRGGMDGDDPPDAADLSPYGILPRRDVLTVLEDVATSVLFPGLERYGIDTAAARASISRI